MGSDSNGNKYLERKYSKTVDTMQKKKTKLDPVGVFIYKGA